MFRLPRLYIGARLKWVQDNPLARSLFDGSLLMLATFSASSFYACGQRELQKSRWDSIKYLPVILSLGIGIAINNARAMLDGFFGKPSEFVRTPKCGVTADGVSDGQAAGQAYSVKRDFALQPWLELAMGLYMSACFVACLTMYKLTLGLPFLALFAGGYLYVAPK